VPKYSSLGCAPLVARAFLYPLTSCLIGPSDIVKLEAGEVINWDVHETLRKVYAYGGD
jgi:hypothetical protein